MTPIQEFGRKPLPRFSTDDNKSDRSAKGRFGNKLSTKQKRKSTMTTLRRNATLAVLALILFGCESEPKPVQVPVTTTTTATTTTTTQTAQVVSLRIGMPASEAITRAGIPCDPSTLKSIQEGANVTLKYGGNSYVFSKGVLEAVR